MACCGNRPASSPKKKTPVLLSLVNYQTDKTSILCRDGQNRSLAQLLIRPPARPAGGWGFTFNLGGQPVEAKGTSAQEVYDDVVRLHKLNGEPFTPVNVWLNLNLTWMNKTDAKFHIAGMRDLLAIASEGPVEKKDPKVRNYAPSDWGAIGWRWLGLWLAKDSYHFRDFLAQVNWVLDMLNPTTNPSIGCVKCYAEFMNHVGKLSENPQMDQAAAREWLFNTHNKISERIGKLKLTWQQAAKANFWI